MRAPGALIGAAFATLLVLQPQSASAAWATTGSGSAPAGAASVERATALTPTQVGSTVRLDWAAAALNEGTPATGYTVLRHAGATVTQVCTTVAPTRSCVDSSPLQAGVQYGVVATFRSWTGQESPLTPFVLDTTSPLTSLASNPAPNAAGWNRSAVTITLTATDAASSVTGITYRIGAGSPVTVAGSSASFGVSAQGSTAITYYATDAYGNVETTRSYTVRIDTTAPATPVITNSIGTDSGAPGDRVTNVAAQTLSGTAEPGSTVTISRGATAFPPVVAAANGAWSAPVTLAEGANSFTAVATDPAGNSSTASAGLSTTLDTLLPTVTTTDPKPGVAYRDSTGPAGARWANTCSGAPGACGTSSDSGSGVTSVTLVLRDVNTGTCWTGTSSTFATCGSPLAVTGTATWSKAIAYAVVTGRSLQLTVTATDLAGNIGTTSVGFSAQ